MSVSDLTNTIWLFNNSITSASGGRYYINFYLKSNSSATYTSILAPNTGTILFYNGESITNAYQAGAWNSSNYKTICITGGNDVTNASLISWLQSNATQLLSDLTNTTWVINDSPSIPSTSTTYNINFNSVTNWTRLRFASNTISYGEWLEEEGEYDYFICYFGSNHTWNGNNYKTIQITGGTDVTNSNLINWLQNNATQQTPTPTPTPTSTGKIGDLPIIKKHFGDLEIIKEVLNGATIYEKK